MNKEAGLADSKINTFGWRFLLPAVTLLERRPAHHRVVGQIADIKKGEKVLEMGAGYPLWRFYSRKTGEQGLFISLDIDPFIQKISRKICRIGDWRFKRETREHFFVADGNKPPFQKESFDVVLVQSYGGGPEVLSQAFLVLKPGGRLVVSEMARPAIRGAARRCKQIGFEEPEVRRTVALNWCAIAKKPNDSF